MTKTSLADISGAGLNDIASSARRSQSCGAQPETVVESEVIDAVGLHMTNMRAKKPGSGTWTPLINAFLILAIIGALVVISTLPQGPGKPWRFNGPTFLLAYMLGTSAVVSLTADASWLARSDKDVVILRRPFVQRLAFFLQGSFFALVLFVMAALSLSGAQLFDSISIAPLFFVSACLLLPLLGIIIWQTFPCVLECRPEKREYDLRHGMPFFGKHRKGSLDDLAGLVVEKNRKARSYAVLVTWRNAPAGLPIGIYEDIEAANTAASSIADAIGIPCRTYQTPAVR